MKIWTKSCFIFLISWIVTSIEVASCESTSGRPCPLLSLDVCSQNETCKQTKEGSLDGICVCEEGYTRINGQCLRNSNSSNDVPHQLPSSTPSTHRESKFSRLFAIWVIIPCMFGVLIGSLLLIIKKYKLIDRLYQLRVRRYNTVLVSSLNDDDAPIQ